MNSPADVPELFDPRRIAAHMERARRIDRPGADFLLTRTLEDLGERLSVITRRFPQALALEDRDGAVRRLLLDSKIAETIVSLGRQSGADVVGDQESLPFAAGRFGLAVSLLTLTFVNDLPGVLTQIRRCLRPDGLCLVALAGGETLTELRQCLLEAETDVTGGAALRVAPFVDVRTLGSLFQRAGFALPVTDCDRVTVRYASMLDLIADLRAMGATAPLAGRTRPLRRAVIARAAAIYAERFADTDGRIRATFDLISGSGWVPHDSQQKPLKPGSAKVSLAEALRAPPPDDL